MPQEKQPKNNLDRAISAFAELWQEPSIMPGCAARGVTRPATRLESIRSWLRSRMRQPFTGAEESQLLRWRDSIHNACAENLADELEQTRQIFYDQQENWSRQVNRASFGTPGFVTRLVALFLWLKCRSETQNLNAARLRLESLRRQNEFIFDSCEGLAAIAQCLCGKVNTEVLADSKSAGQERRVERFIKLAQETLITQELMNRGSHLKQEQVTLHYQTQIMREHSAKALRYITSEPIRQARLRKNFESNNKANARKTFERLIHSGYVCCAAVAEQEFNAASTRLEILKSEYNAIRKLLFAKLERLGSYADLTKHTDQNQIWPKGTEVEERYGNAFRNFKKQI